MAYYLAIDDILGALANVRQERDIKKTRVASGRLKHTIVKKASSA